MSRFLTPFYISLGMTLRSHSGHLFFVFLPYPLITGHMLLFVSGVVRTPSLVVVSTSTAAVIPFFIILPSRIYTISSIYVLAVGNTPYGEWMIAVYIWRKLAFTAIFFLLLPDQFDAFFNPRNVSEMKSINIKPPSIGQLEKRTSSRTTDAV